MSVPEPWSLPQTLVQSAWLGSDFTVTICGPVWAAGVLAAGVPGAVGAGAVGAGAAGFFGCARAGAAARPRPARPRRAARASVAVRVKDIGSDPLEETWCGWQDAEPAWRQVRRTVRMPAALARSPELRMNRSDHRGGTGARRRASLTPATGRPAFPRE